MRRSIVYIPFSSDNPDTFRFDPDEYDHCPVENCIVIDLFTWRNWVRHGLCGVCEGRETRSEVFLTSSQLHGPCVLLYKESWPYYVITAMYLGLGQSLEARSM